jgi:hypothetical protein
MNRIYYITVKVLLNISCILQNILSFQIWMPNSQFVKYDFLSLNSSKHYNTLVGIVFRKVSLFLRVLILTDVLGRKCNSR